MEEPESAADQIKCRYCGKAWPPESFRTPRGKPTTHCRACLEAKRARTRLKRERIGPAGVRAANLWDKYRITVEQYDALRAAQQYRCRICGTHEDDITAILTGRPRLDGTPTARAVRLVVDHCHNSRQVRGLLCNNCNTMIGLSSEDPVVLRAGAAYLEASAPR
jgi:hypothetical protein